MNELKYFRLAAVYAMFEERKIVDYVPLDGLPGSAMLTSAMEAMKSMNFDWRNDQPRVVSATRNGDNSCRIECWLSVEQNMERTTDSKAARFMAFSVSGCRETATVRDEFRKALTAALQNGAPGVDCF